MSLLSRILSIYVGWRFATSFFAILAGIAGLSLLFDTIELLRRSAGIESLGFASVFGLALMKLPHTAEATLPFVVMLAMMYALFRLSRSHELMVMRAAGISVWQFLAPPVLLAFALGAINLMVIDPFAASLYDSEQRIEDALFRHATQALNLGRGGLWLRDANGNDAIILHAESVHQEDGVLHLATVTVFQLEKEKLHARFEAASGQLLDGFLKLDKVWDIEAGPPRASAFHNEYFLPTTLTMQEIQNSFTPPETMSFWELPDYIRQSEAAGFSALPHRLYWQSLLASPFLLCAMILVAAAFYLTLNIRLVGWTVRGAGGIGAGFLLYFFNKFALALGESSTLPLVFAAWAPTVVTAMMGLAYLFHREDG